MTAPFRFDNSYARLPRHFYANVAPTPARAPHLIKLNRALAEQLGLDPEWLSSAEGVEVLAGSRLPPEAQPIATAYAGHQFGHFVPQLGDGRAILLGEVVDRDGVRRDVQLKGSGRTPFSRSGDGRAALGPVLREYIVSEAMAALGIPTTRSLAAVMTGEPVYREEVLPGAVLTRVASSHIRVGTFQFFAARQDVAALRTLADHVIARHYPEVSASDRPYQALLAAVVARQADLIARWLLVGFIHGVMNTDNMSVAGETIDYGPCAFMDSYDPAKVYSSIDQMGRYAYANQPGIGLWNLTRLAETLLPLFSDQEADAVKDAEAVLEGFAPAFHRAYEAGLRRKVGLATEQPGDRELIQDLLKAMAENGADFTLTFRRLADAADADPGAGATENSAADSTVRSLFADGAAYDAWAQRWRERLAAEPASAEARAAAMRAVNPAFIPRNHRIEAAIQAAIGGDFGPFEALVAVLSRPFDDQPSSEFMQPPQPHEEVRQTFCGT